MNDPLWIRQQPDWPHFTWQAEPLAPLPRACIQAQGRLLGMLDGGERSFEDGISAAHYQAEAKVSKATATRHLSDVVEKAVSRGSRGRAQHPLSNPLRDSPEALEL